MRPGTAVLILAFWVSGLAPGVRAEVHTWVDADGDRHYGDRVPPRYRSRSRPVETDAASVVESVPLDLPPLERPVPADEPEDVPDSTAPGASPPDTEPMSCTRRQRAWRRSKACFRGCRQEIADGGWNNARCGHCREMTPPDC